MLEGQYTKHETNFPTLMHSIKADLTPSLSMEVHYCIGLAAYLKDRTPQRAYLCRDRQRYGTVHASLRGLD